MGNKILIADDSKMVISLVKSIFENQNDLFNVVSANDGREAIELALKESPDIILMDWQMPEISGIDALKKLKKSEKTKDIPVIMLTATESSSEAFEAGACDLIPKPFNKHELIARVKNIIELVNSKSELKSKIIENEIQNDKLKSQKDILIKQKKEITMNHELSSKVYKIIHSNGSLIKRNVADSFLLSLSISDIPANFLWEMVQGNQLYFCIGFLSKENISSFIYTSTIINCLNQFYIENLDEKDLQPSMFLAFCRDKLIDILNNSEEMSKRIMDIILCKIDLDKKIMSYSGINVPIFVVKNDKLVELKSDKSALGFISNDFKITNHKVQLAKGDTLYILNDGFSESNSGVIEKSYISDEISSLFMKVYKKEMGKQKTLFEKTFESWRKELKQLKDILALGIKL